MPRPRQKPSYCLHRPTGQAYTRLNGKMIYLGEWDSARNRARYGEIVDEWALRENPTGAVLSIDDLVLKFMAYARGYYQKDGRPTSEVHCLQLAARYIVRVYGPTPARLFGPSKLKAVRAAMVKDGHCRTSINQHCSRIRRIFKWASGEELLPSSVYRTLQDVAGLEAGRTDAEESDPVLPVPLDDVEAIKPFLTAPVLGLVEFQLATGCRPSEALTLRGIDIAIVPGGEVWEYRPRTHKLAHRKKPRVVFIGPKAQEVVRRYQKDDPNAYLFSPREVRKAIRGATRQPGERYNIHGYRNAVKRACARAGVPEWSPNRLRHNFGTLARTEAGIDAVRVLLGHSKLNTTEIYAEADGDKARAVVARIG
ncbi:MAG: site-specific integrase [Planctomycetaceae bacterium]|nr:site-specific integrase [Planctomycetaceae bacterium]